MKRLKAFAYYGGKNSKLNWLLPLLPYEKYYIEPFAGSAAVLLNRSISSVEVLNDLDGRIFNFFNMLRDRPNELIKKLELTLYSRREFENCFELSQNIEQIIKDNPIEAARCFFVLTQQSYLNKHAHSKGEWARTLTRVRNNMNKMVSGWLSKLAGLLEVSSRLKTVLLENKCAISLIEEYNTKEAFIYCDPSYLPDVVTKTKSYVHNQPHLFHEKLLDVCLRSKAKIAISGYESELYNNMLSDWFVYKNKEHKLGGKNRQSTNDGVRRECVWMNYDYSEIRHNEQSTLDMF